MLKIRQTAAAVACLSGAAVASGVHWSVDAPTAGGAGFIAYGVLIVQDGGNGPPNASDGGSLPFFSSPFQFGPDPISFGGALPLAAQDGGPASSTAGALDITTGIDGDGTSTVRVMLRADGSTTRIGTEAFSVSSDPNNRAVFSLRPQGADPSLPLRVFFVWTASGWADASAPFTADTVMGGEAGVRRTGDIVFNNFMHFSLLHAAAPVNMSGGHTLVVAPTDLDRDIEVSVRMSGGYTISGAAGVAGPADAGGVEAAIDVAIQVRQFCPGDTDGDGLVNFADLNVVVGSFNATGAVGEHAGDINGDGRVDFADLNMTLTNFGQNGC